MTEPTTPTTSGAPAATPADPSIDDLEQRAAALAEEPADLQPFADLPNGSPDDGPAVNADGVVDVTTPQGVRDGTS